MNDLQVGGNFSIVVRDIHCKNGNSVVMVSPHALNNGTVDIDGVFGESCGFALRIEGGFIATKYVKDPSIKIGGYEKVVAKNIKAIYGVDAQLKSKHFKYMPCELRSQIKDVTGNENREEVAKAALYVGPAIGAAMNTDEYPTFISNVEAIGFINKPILSEEDANNCGEVTKEATKTVKKAKNKGKKKNKQD